MVSLRNSTISEEVSEVGMHDYKTRDSTVRRLSSILDLLSNSQMLFHLRMLSMLGGFDISIETLLLFREVSL
jgi:hypothetical protein